jgi:amidase
LNGGTADLDATAQAELVRRGGVSPAELVDAAIARIEALNPELNAVIHPRFEQAREEARGELADGPFRGVPILVKDLVAHTAGDPFHCGMALLKELGWTEADDAPSAARIRAAGFVIVGRTNTPELGMTCTTEPAAYGPTRNPWDVTRSPGGSSGGSAAAVASRMVPIAHATDGGGSIRIPSSACGLFGLKPSRGRAASSRVGDMAGFSVEGVVARSVRDASAMLDVLSETPVERAPVTERLRIGVMMTTPAGVLPVHPDSVSAVEEAASLTGTLGHTVEAVHPPALDELEHVIRYGAITGVDVLAQLGRWSARTGRPIGPGDVEPHTWMLAEMGRAVTESQMRESLEWLAGYTERVTGWWGTGFDLLLTPTLAEPPPKLGELVSTREEPFKGAWRAGAVVPFTPPFNTTGQPAMSVPLWWNGDGLPIGVQFVAAPGREDVLLALAAQLEEARPWADRKPPVSA